MMLNAIGHMEEPNKVMLTTMRYMMEEMGMIKLREISLVKVSKKIHHNAHEKEDLGGVLKLNKA